MSFTPIQHLKNFVPMDVRGLGGLNRGELKNNLIQASFGGLGAKYVQDSDTADAAQKAADESVAAAKKLADEQDQAFNKANQKRPNYMAIKSGNAGSYDDTLLAGRKGNGGLLGKNTLLGA